MQSRAKKDHTIELIDLRDYDITHFHQENSPRSEELISNCEEADNFIFGSPIYNYNLADSFCSFVTKHLPKKKHSLYSLVLAGGGVLSFLTSSNAHQMLMTHNGMIPLPAFLYTTKNDWEENGNASESFQERMDEFITDFVEVAEKLK